MLLHDNTCETSAIPSHVDALDIIFIISVRVCANNSFITLSIEFLAANNKSCARKRLHLVAKAEIICLCEPKVHQPRIFLHSEGQPTAIPCHFESLDAIFFPSIHVFTHFSPVTFAVIILVTNSELYARKHMQLITDCGILIWPDEAKQLQRFVFCRGTGAPSSIPRHLQTWAAFIRADSSSISLLIILPVADCTTRAWESLYFVAKI
mmetsp:Transcript_73912/g.117075  ORF Transcript_73912/g.117075 Transcript_73912/m.117075 type:complete len:208 (-) Transcript_73912:590-1213(-)